MKVLIVSPKFHPIIGGGETFVLSSAIHSKNAGVNVAVVVEPNSNRNLSYYPYPVHEVEGLSDTNLQPVIAADNLQKVITSFKPDIIHAHGYFALLILGLCFLGKSKTVTSIHSTPVWGQRIFGGMSSFESELAFARSVLDLSKHSVITVG